MGRPVGKANRRRGHTAKGGPCMSQTGGQLWPAEGGSFIGGVLQQQLLMRLQLLHLKTNGGKNSCPLLCTQGVQQLLVVVQCRTDSLPSFRHVLREVHRVLRGTLDGEEV